MAIQLLSRYLDTGLEAILKDTSAENSELKAGQVIDFVTRLIKRNGCLQLKDAQGNVHPVPSPSPLEVIGLVNLKAKNILSKQKETAAAIEAGLNEVKLAFAQGNKALLQKLHSSDMSEIQSLKQALDDISKSLPEKSSLDLDPNAQVEVFAAIFFETKSKLEVSKPQFTAKDLESAMTESLRQEAAVRGLSKDLAGKLSGEFSSLELFIRAKEMAKAGLQAESLVMVLKPNTDIEATNKEFSEGKHGLDAEQLGNIQTIFADFVSQINNGTSLPEAKIKLENRIATLKSDQEKLFCKYLVTKGQEMNSGFDFKTAFSELGNYIPSLLGSGVLGLIFSSLMGVNGLWGVAGSLIMTALAATEQSPEPGETRVVSQRQSPTSRQRKSPPAHTAA